MTKLCPIKLNGSQSCTNNCAWWDEEKSQCCFKTLAQATAKAAENPHRIVEIQPRMV